MEPPPYVLDKYFYIRLENSALATLNLNGSKFIENAIRSGSLDKEAADDIFKYKCPGPEMLHILAIIPKQRASGVACSGHAAGAPAGQRAGRPFHLSPEPETSMYEGPFGTPLSEDIIPRCV